MVAGGLLIVAQFHLTMADAAQRMSLADPVACLTVQGQRQPVVDGGLLLR